MMCLGGIDKPDPRKQFIQDLKTLVKTLHDADHSIILMGDFNKSIGVNAAGIASVMTKGELNDVFVIDIVSSRKNPPTHKAQKGCTLYSCWLGCSIMFVKQATKHSISISSLTTVDYLLTFHCQVFLIVPRMFLSLLRLEPS
jgi:hypothetical protein